MSITTRFKLYTTLFNKISFEDGVYRQLEFLKTGCNVLSYDMLSQN